jgi:hypothetical protein
MKGLLYISIICCYIIYAERIESAVCASISNQGRSLVIVRAYWRCGGSSGVKV